MSKKKKKRDEGGPDPATATATAAAEPSPPRRAAPPSTLPTPIAVLGGGLCMLAALLVCVSFLRSIPDAAARARVGVTRAAESACMALRPEPNNAALGELPQPAPDFRLKDYAGREVHLADLKGSVVLVNFWATWCKTCVVEMASMERLVNRMRGKPFRLLAVSVDDDWPQVRKFFARGTPLEVLLDTDRKTPKAYGTDKFPESFLVDKDGVVRYYVVSNRDWGTGDVAECVQSLMD
jgi:peroxiredoxin